MEKSEIQVTCFNTAGETLVRAIIPADQLCAFQPLHADTELVVIVSLDANQYPIAYTEREYQAETRAAIEAKLITSELRDMISETLFANHNEAPEGKYILGVGPDMPKVLH